MYHLLFSLEFSLYQKIDSLCSMCFSLCVMDTSSLFVLQKGSWMYRAFIVIIHRWGEVCFVGIVGKFSAW